MRFTFLHFADCHLGYRQYGHKERFNDFARAFLDVIRRAIDAQVDFVVLAGDLFQKRAIDALTLNQAVHGLRMLQDAGIPCLAVEGNHELAYYHDTIGWMEFLAQQDLLILLNPDLRQDGESRLRAYANKRGAYFDPLPGVRVYGLRYMGASTAKALEIYTQLLAQDPPREQGIDYTIFVAHTGVEGVLPGHMGGLSHRQLAPLRPFVDYLALGHIHKPYEFGGWIYNPGSPETCSLDEVSWPERGYYLVQVDTEKPPESEEPRHQAQLHANRRRPFLRLHVKVDLAATPQALYDHCQEVIARKARDHAQIIPQQPVVSLTLTGTLAFERSQLDMVRLRALVEEHFSPLLVLAKNGAVSRDISVDPSDRLNRQELERQVLTELAEQRPLFQGQGEAWAELAIQLKQMVAESKDVSPEAILDEFQGWLAQHPAPEEQGAAQEEETTL